MTYREALKIVKNEFETRYVDTACRAIRINLTYDGINELYIAICDNGDEALITDEGITKDIFYNATDKAEWVAMCEKNGFSFNRYWHIERRFTDISDVHDFIHFLMEISERFNPLHAPSKKQDC